MTPDPTGEVVASVSYNETTLRLEIVTVGGWYLVIDNDFIVNRPSGLPLDSASTPEAATTALSMIVGTIMTQFRAGLDGHLELSFTDGHEVEVATAEDFEAWHLTGPPPRRQRIVCMPGGELAIWS